MSLKSRQTRKLATASIAAVAALGVGTSAADAAVPNVPDVTLEYTCKYPIVDKQPLSIKVSSNIPQFALLRVNQPAFQINAVATAGGDTARAINTLNAYSIEGSSEAFADLEFPDGFIQEDLFVPLVVQPWIRPNSDPVTGNLVLNANGDTPSVQLEPEGDAIIRLDRITLNLVAKGQSGNIINVRKLTTDFDGNPVVPADSTPNDFNVYCKLNPGQSNTIATIKVVTTLPGENKAPNKVVGLSSPAQSTDSVDLSWTPATDPDAGDTIKEYRVYQGTSTTPVKTVTSGTSTTITGLNPETPYDFKVTAVDSATPALEGPASDAVTATTKKVEVPTCTADTTPPTAPTDGVYLPDRSDIGRTTLNVRWGASTDPADPTDPTCPISGIDYYIVDSENEPDVQVPAGTLQKLFTDLGEDSEYRFIITAVDKAGNRSEDHDEFLITTGPVVDPNKAPSQVANVKGVPTLTSVALSWDAATDPDAGDSVAKYNVYQGATLVKTVNAPATSVTVDGLTANTAYTFQVEAVDTKGPLAGPKSAALAVTTLKPNTAPSKVANVKGVPALTSVALSWNAATDPDAGDSVAKYNVYQGATLVKTVNAPATSVTVDGLTANTAYSFQVEAVDTKGPLAGPKSDAAAVTTLKPNAAPSVPTALKTGAITSSTIALSWTASTDDVKVAGYNVYRDGVKVGTSATTSYTATGLAPLKAYSFTVEAYDEPGLVSPKSAAVSGTTIAGPVGCPEGFACQGYTLAGSTTLKTLTTGVLPLKGGIDAQLDPSNGKFTADLVLNPTTGRLTALSFLPITVKIAFAPSGKTTGTLDDNNILRSKSFVRIKVTEVKLFGAIPLAGGNSCQTKSLSEINLTSTKAFEIFKGGTLTGQYAISDLNGCGALNGLVSPLTAGKGNTISLNLTPKP